MTIVGIIANPAAGKDIRRIVAHGRFVPNHEKVNILKRVLAGLAATQVKRALMMPDSAMICRSAASGAPDSLQTELLDIPMRHEEDDSTKAAEAMAGAGAACIVTLGGDGTNRAIAKGSGRVPLVPISTGTNNVFPYMIEGTVAGLAAGVVASGRLSAADVTIPAKLLEVSVDGTAADVALIDAAVTSERFLGARAVWDMTTLHEIFLARAEPDGIGLSAIGARLRPAALGDDSGLHLRIGEPGTVVSAPIAPGVIENVPVQDWSPMPIGEPRTVNLSPCVIALDGERSVRVAPGQTAQVTLTRSGPPVVDVPAALSAATDLGLFTTRP